MQLSKNFEKIHFRPGWAENDSTGIHFRPGQAENDSTGIHFRPAGPEMTKKSENHTFDYESD